MADNDFAKGFGLMLALIVGVAAVGFVVAVVLPTTISIGAVFGGGLALNNYLRSFIRNVRPESDPRGLMAKTLVALVLTALLIVIILIVLAVVDKSP